MSKFRVHSLSPRNYRKTVLWSVFLCLAIVTMASALGRATRNFNAALVDKPDVAIYLLLPDEGLRQTTLLRESDTERDYLAEAEGGPKLIKMKKGAEQWYVSLVEPLHAGEER